MKKIICLFLPFVLSCNNKPQYNKSLNLALKSDTLLLQNKLDEAETIIAEAIRLDNSNHIAYNNLGVLRRKRGMTHQEIIEPFVKSLTIRPDYETAVYNLADFYYHLKDYKNSIIYCTKYLVLAKNNNEASNDIAHIYTIRSESKNLDKKFTGAILDSDSALIFNPNSYGAYKERASAYRELRQFDEAIKNYLKAIDIKPDYAQAYNGLGICYDDGKKDLNKALQYYTKAIDLDSQNAIYVYNRGACLFDNGLKEKALSDLRKADSLGKQEAKSYLEKY